MLVRGRRSPQPNCSWETGFKPSWESRDLSSPGSCPFPLDKHAGLSRPCPGCAACQQRRLGLCPPRSPHAALPEHSLPTPACSNPLPQTRQGSPWHAQQRAPTQGHHRHGSFPPTQTDQNQGPGLRNLVICLKCGRYQLLSSPAEGQPAETTSPSMQHSPLIPCAGPRWSIECWDL